MRVCSGPRQRSGSYQVMRPPEGPVRGAGQVGLRAAREGRQQVDGSPRRVPTWYPPDGGRTTPQIISAGRSHVTVRSVGMVILAAAIGYLCARYGIQLLLELFG